jgi:5-methylcytosine-specific restriction endonuclease McrA
MKLEIIILALTGFFIINIYKDGKYLNMLKQWKKYYQMAFYGFIGLSLLLFIKKYPSQTKDLCLQANNFVKFTPIDKESKDLLSPILKFASHNYNNYNNYNSSDYHESSQIKRMSNSGSNANSNVKRSVGETKKKYIAAQQNWKCGKCGCMLPAWFEVDHKLRLEYGGSNHISNLEALCRNCHGEKTALEKL